MRALITADETHEEVIMGTPYQIAIDCSDPHDLVRFWAAAMDLEVEDHDPQIRQLVEQGWASDDDYIESEGRLAWKAAAACRGDGGRTRLLFQVVLEEKHGKNRVHLDLHVGPDRLQAEVERLIGLGASRLWDGQQGPHTWVTMADPEGNEFCVS